MGRNLMELGEIGLKVLLILEASELVRLELVMSQGSGILGALFLVFVWEAQEECITWYGTSLGQGMPD